MNDASPRHAIPPSVGAGLKILVIVMGVLIAAGVAVLGVAIVQRGGEAGSGVSEDYATAAVPLPAGSRVLAMSGEGDAITLLIEADGDQSLVTIDRKTGRVLGTLTLSDRP